MCHPSRYRCKRSVSSSWPRARRHVIICDGSNRIDLGLTRGGILRGLCKWVLTRSSPPYSSSVIQQQRLPQDQLVSTSEVAVRDGLPRWLLVPL